MSLLLRAGREKTESVEARESDLGMILEGDGEAKFAREKESSRLHVELCLVLVLVLVFEWYWFSAALTRLSKDEMGGRVTLLLDWYW